MITFRMVSLAILLLKNIPKTIFMDEICRIVNKWVSLISCLFTSACHFSVYYWDTRLTSWQVNTFSVYKYWMWSFLCHPVSRCRARWEVWGEGIFLGTFYVWCLRCKMSLLLAKLWTDYMLRNFSLFNDFSLPVAWQPFPRCYHDTGKRPLTGCRD